MKIRENVAISELTTMRLGGKADFVIEIETKDDIEQAYAFARERDLPTYVFGSGSNIIGRDGGFRGVIVLARLKGMGVISEDETGAELFSYSGELLDDFVAFSTEKNLSGIEALSKIPGTVGAAPVQNVGAYGQDIMQVLTKVEVFDTRDRVFKTFSRDELKLSYRRSIFNYGAEVGRYFIVKICVRLTYGQMRPPFYASLEKYIQDNKITDFSPSSIRKCVSAIRDSKLPDPNLIASSGSFFKNVYLSPEEAKEAASKGIPVWEGGKAPSGWLIENTGLKGKVFHGMRVSDKAALVLINETAESYADLAAAREEIIAAVREKFNYTLEQEPMEIGE